MLRAFQCMAGASPSPRGLTGSTRSPCARRGLLTQPVRVRASVAWTPDGLTRRGAQPSSFLREPSASALVVSSKPPMSTPRTNTWGKVGQPLHILMASRCFHMPK